MYSTADQQAQFVQLADEAVCIGGPQPADSYLNMENILSAALLTGAQAIHPGYGFCLKVQSSSSYVRNVKLLLLDLRPRY